MLATTLLAALFAVAPAEQTAAPLLASALASKRADDADQPLRRDGRFGLGIALQPITFGVIQAISDGETALGAQMMVALQIDLSRRLALRLPLDIAIGGSDDHGFTSLGFTPGLVYRLRSRNDQGFVPYFGGGFKLGGTVAGVGLLGIPAVGTGSYALSRAHISADLDWDDGDGEPDPDTRVRLGAFPEVWAGAEVHLGRVFSLDLGLAYTYHRLAHRGVHMLSERLGLRVTF